MRVASTALVLVLATVATQCTSGPQVDLPTSRSNVTAINLPLPGKTQFSNAQQRLLSGFHLSAQPTASSVQASSCVNPINTELVKSWDVSRTIALSVTQGCDYNITLEAGNLSADEKSLEQALYSTATAANPVYLLKASDFGIATKYSIKLALVVTQGGIDAGFTSTSDGNGQTDIAIDYVPGGSGQDDPTPPLPIDPVLNPSTDPPAKPTPATTSSLRQIAITVNQGYSPSSITVAVGESVELLVTRTESGGCAGSIIFTGYNITKDLPTGQTVHIILPAMQQPAPLSFACGMGMYKGSIIVQ